MAKYSHTSVTVFRGGVTNAVFVRSPRRSPLAHFIGQHTIPVVVSGIARRTTTKTIVQSSRREDHGSKFRGSTL